MIGGTDSVLNVSILTESDVGVYRCEVKNSAGLSGSNTTTIELGGEYWRFFHLAILLQIGLYSNFEDKVFTDQSFTNLYLIHPHLVYCIFNIYACDSSSIGAMVLSD